MVGLEFDLGLSGFPYDFSSDAVGTGNVILESFRESVPNITPFSARSKMKQLQVNRQNISSVDNQIDQMCVFSSFRSNQFSRLKS